jgi:hypothetical protein
MVQRTVMVLRTTQNPPLTSTLHMHVLFWDLGRRLSSGIHRCLLT